MALEFDRSVQSTTFYSPLEDFEEVTVDVEVRTDPLTDRTARIVPDNFLMPDEEPDIDPVVGDSEGCFFCPDSVGEVTPTYPDWVGFDRGRVGEATSFPNLNPYGAHSNVVALTEDHYRPIDEFTTAVFRDGLQAALEFVNRALDHDESAEFASVNMNFLRPAGSSIIHPHMQTLVDDRGTNEQALLTRAAREYYDEHESVYWQDLVEAVTSTDRYLGSTGGADWLAPFAPKHHRHVVGVCEESGVPGPEDGAVADLAEGIVNVLEYYGSVGLNSFNFALYLSAEAAMQPVVDVVGRSVFDQYYWSDSSFFSVLHGEGVVDVAPETYAGDAQEFF
jgi:galactose-1-phosphate uridylyltransferase